MPKSVKIISYEPIHGYLIVERNTREADVKLSMAPGWENAIREWKRSGPAYTLVVDGEFIACSGVILFGCGRGDAWMLTSMLVQTYKRIFLISVKKYLDLVIREHGLRRVQATCDPERKGAMIFLEHLGFKNETPHGMKGYGSNGETMAMLARVA